MRHVIVTRFSVPRPHDPVNAASHANGVWLDRRLELFRSFFVPSVASLGVPVILLCSRESAPIVSAATEDLEWVRVVVQDEWYGGWSGDADHIVTRMDSDDALHQGWFAALDASPAEAEVCCTKSFLRYDPGTGRLCRYWRREPCPLAAFRNGGNPFAHNHADLEKHYRTHVVKGPYLLQIYHGGNVSTRRPSWYRPRTSLDRLKEFGLR